jgi:uncharacterized protein (TIGR03000 family)
MCSSLRLLLLLSFSAVVSLSLGLGGEPATRPTDAEKDNRAHLLVILPANAELWFDGKKTRQTGSQRKFISPVLTTGKHYSYEIKAIWRKDGERVEQVRTANVQANDWQKIDFTKADAEQVIERFPIDKDTSQVLLPVTIDGNRYRLSVDTGSPGTAYDKSLRHRLGKIIAREKVGPTDENIMIPFFQPPDARLGRLALPKDSAVMGIDLTELNKSSGEELQGILGMDFLKAHIFRIDFDRGEVVFLGAVGPDPGQRLAIRLTNDQPQVKINLPGLKEPEWFVLDTGCVRGDGALWGSVRKPVFDALIRSGKLTSIYKGPQTRFAGERIYRFGWLDSLPFAGNTYKNLLFSEKDFSLLGLELLSRYVVTFDFPHRAIFLKKGRQFDRPIREQLSGLNLERVKGQTVVGSVFASSPAAQAGLRSGDTLLQIDKQSIDGMTLFTLRNRLCEEGKRVQLTVRRGGQRLDISLLLSSDNLKRKGLGPRSN